MSIEHIEPLYYWLLLLLPMKNISVLVYMLPEPGYFVKNRNF